MEIILKEPTLKKPWRPATAAATLQIRDMIGWMKKENLAARAARISVHFVDVCQTTTWKFKICGSDDNAITQL